MIERKTTLFWVLAPTAFEAINQIALVSSVRPLGTGVASVNKMIACAEEMEMLLPDVLGISPKSSNSDWNGAVSNYWHNFGLDVPLEGMTFNISLNVDINDYKRSKYINEFLVSKKLKDATTTEKINAIEDYLKEPTTPEEIKYRFASPVDVTQYLIWRYCLVSNLVANDPSFIKLSNNIKFYLMDDAKADAKKEEIAKVKSSAIRKFTNIIQDKEITKIDNLLVAADKIMYLNDIKKLKRVDKENILMDMAVLTPSDFLKLVGDDQIASKAEIKKLVMSGSINKIPNTSIYVDASDPSQVLGNTLDEVITYMANIKNAAYVNELRIKFNALTV